MGRYIKCSEKAHRLVRVRAADTGDLMQDIADKAVFAYLADTEKSADAYPPEAVLEDDPNYAPANRACHDMLEAILNCSAAEVRVYKSTLNHWYESVQPPSPNPIPMDTASNPSEGDSCGGKRINGPAKRAPRPKRTPKEAN